MAASELPTKICSNTYAHGRLRTFRSSLEVGEEDAGLYLAEQLENGLGFHLSKVWFKLDMPAGYYGIHWHCVSGPTLFRVHCTIANWNAGAWYQEALRSCDAHVDLVELGQTSRGVGELAILGQLGHA